MYMIIIVYLILDTITKRNVRLVIYIVYNIVYIVYNIKYILYIICVYIMYIYNVY